jgi:hypothetical protein
MHFHLHGFEIFQKSIGWDFCLFFYTFEELDYLVEYLHGLGNENGLFSGIL